MRRTKSIQNFISGVCCVYRMSTKNPGFLTTALTTAALCLISSPALAQVAPTWVHRFVPDIAEKTADLSTDSCHYLPIFGEGDAAARIARAAPERASRRTRVNAPTSATTSTLFSLTDSADPWPWDSRNV